MLVTVILCHGDAQVRNLESMDPAAFAAVHGVIVVSAEDLHPVFPCPSIVVAPSDTPGFNAGANRDKGLTAARLHFPGCAVVFLDGDCSPCQTWAQAHLCALHASHPVMACGARTEDGKPDPRTLPLEWQDSQYQPSMVPGGREDFLPSEILAHRVAWSCNLSLNDAAIRLLQVRAQLVHGSTRLFAPMFDGLWGGEDTGICTLAAASGVRICTLDPQLSEVRHIPHDSFHVTRRNLDRVTEYAGTIVHAFKSQEVPIHCGIFQEVSITSQEYHMTDTPSTSPVLPTHMSQEDMTKTAGAYTSVQESSARLQEASAAVAKAREVLIGAQAVLVHVSKEIGAKYSLGPNDTVEPDGVIARNSAGA